MTAVGPDLAELAVLLSALPAHARAGLVTGKTSFKNVIAQHLQCSEAEAERLVDIMVGRGFLRLEKSAGALDAWTVHPDPQG